VRTSLSQFDESPGRGWRVLFTEGLGVRALDVLEPLPEWFYATEYISSVSQAFWDLRRRVVVVFLISIDTLCVLSNYTS